MFLHPAFDQNSIYLIAEIGVNHNGSVALAKRLVEEAKIAGADAVKFQSFTAKNLAALGTPKVKYQLSNSAKEESHLEMLESLELTFDQ